ncbi:MAG: restriction endonuclease subunit S, partial [Chitinophagaceae bacterium]
GAQQNLNSGIIRNYEINIPDLPTQTRIASILSSLDDKIALNRRMNATLEQLAATLFKKYFVDDIDPDNLPEGWRFGKVGEMLELVYGKALKENDRKGGKYPVLGSSGIVGYHDVYLSTGNGIMVGRKGNAGAVIWVFENFFPIDTTYYVRDILETKGRYFYYFLLKELNLGSLNSDSAVPGLNRNHAHSQEVLIPTKDAIIHFNHEAKTFFDKIENNNSQNRFLTSLRDTLLPKLMSGEVDLTTITKN